jgi:GNAT superfamily N-acetyltransferase
MRGRGRDRHRAASPAPAQDVRFSLHDELPREDAASVDHGLGLANEAAAPLHEVRPLACFAHSPDGTVLGGAVGRTWGICCELQQLWVEQEHRRQGLGAALIRQFEAAAQARGCKTAYLETFSFQAPGLYRSMGYEVRLALHGFSPGIIKFTMVHVLRDDEHPAA